MVGASVTAVLESHDPATGALVGSVPLTVPEDLPALMSRARQAQAAWAALSLEERREQILRAAPLFAERAASMGSLLSSEMGKPVREAVGEVRSCGAGLEADLDEMVQALTPEVLEDGRTRTVLYRDPLGVCAAITPWNFPVAMPHWLVIPALMAGNAVLLKPSEETPLCGQAYADVLCEVLPPGLLQVVHGADELGRALVASDVDLIAFTGSRDAGAHILGAASTALKRVILELGGKDPLIVLADADVDQAAKFAVRNSFRNAGQVCVSTERIYVHESLADAFEEAVVARASQWVQGPGTQEGVQVGPMVNARQRDHVVNQIDSAVAAGARVLHGGDGHEGNFVVPTVLSGLDHSMDILNTETFGPVACIVRVGSDDEAVRLANDTPYGLGAVVFGSDPDRAAAVARRLEAGMVGINRGVGGAAGSPWVGAKQSGFGFHSGRDGHRQFAQARIISSHQSSPGA
ncbi:MAG TPA: aldehyde dehydrogenase [Deltaproteobacteria bacterium]|mgnify:CR=1 FL=1|nr:aldehyde dehydrogenase [Deltaproteobacteria bacterium]HCP46795.1 aldehyde dehydrogenase [Deltaproteobacteria bacterium]